MRLFGIAELLGGLGLILPAALSIASILTPIAATGLAIIMVLAAITHIPPQGAVRSRDQRGAVRAS